MQHTVPRRERTLRALAAALSLAVFAPAAGSGGRAAGRPGDGPGAPASWPRAPLLCIENRGQWDAAVRFATRIAGVTAGFEDRRIVLRTSRASSGTSTVALELEGARPGLCPEGRRPLGARINFHLGRDAARWRRDVPAYAELVYPSVHPGVDVRFHERDGVLAYDLLLEPWADLDRVVLRCTGVGGLAVDPDGRLVLETGAGPLVQRAPKTWYELPDGARIATGCRFRPLEGSAFGFELAAPRRRERLVVDPGIVWGSYLGGGVFDYARVTAAAGNGDVLVGGASESLDFPATPEALSSSNAGGLEAFVARFDRTGSMLKYATFLGGSRDDACQGIVLDASSAAVLTGETFSADLPVTPGAFDQVLNDAGQTYRNDAFVARLAADGGALSFCTYLGGSDLDEAYEPSLDASGNVVVPGLTRSADFPTTPGAFDGVLDGPSDAFVAVLDPTGCNLLAATLLGGTGDESCRCSAAGPEDDLLVAGYTTSPDFPATAGTIGVASGGARDAFVARLPTDLSGLVAATHVGGEGEDFAYDVALDGEGRVFVTGFTGSALFPVTPGAVDTTINGLIDAFLVCLAPDLTGTAFATYLGGNGLDLGASVVIDATGACVVGGVTFSPNWPATPLAFDLALGGPVTGGSDGFVARISPDGGTLGYSTFVGGGGFDWVNALAALPEGGVAAVGSTSSADFPTTTGAFDTSFNDTLVPGNDGWVAHLDLLPAGVLRVGSSTPCSRGPVTIGLEGIPLAGTPLVSVTSSGGPPSATGVLVIGTERWTSAPSIGGVTVHVQLHGNVLLVPVTSDAQGRAALSTALPPGSGGAVLYAQWFWNETEPCAGGAPLSASAALRVAVR